MFVPPPDHNRQPPPPFATEAEMTGYLGRLGLTYSKTALITADGREAFEWQMHYCPDPQGFRLSGDIHNHPNDFWAEFSYGGRQSLNFYLQLAVAKDEYLTADVDTRTWMDRCLARGNTPGFNMTNVFLRARQFGRRYEEPDYLEHCRRAREGDHGDVRWMDELLTLGPGHVYLSKLYDWDHMLYLMRAFAAQEQRKSLHIALPSGSAADGVTRGRL